MGSTTTPTQTQCTQKLPWGECENTPSGQDVGPVAERSNPNDQVPTEWHLDSGHVALLNLSDNTIEVEGPGGTELISNQNAEAGMRTLLPGQGEIWAPE